MQPDALDCGDDPTPQKRMNANFHFCSEEINVQIKEDFRRNAQVKDIVSIKYLVSDGRKKLKELEGLLDRVR